MRESDVRGCRRVIVGTESLLEPKTGSERFARCGARRAEVFAKNCTKNATRRSGKRLIHGAGCCEKSNGRLHNR